MQRRLFTVIGRRRAEVRVSWQHRFSDVEVLGSVPALLALVDPLWGPDSCRFPRATPNDRHAKCRVGPVLYTNPCIHHLRSYRIWFALPVRLPHHVLLFRPSYTENLIMTSSDEAVRLADTLPTSTVHHHRSSKLCVLSISHAHRVKIFLSSACRSTMGKTISVDIGHLIPRRVSELRMPRAPRQQPQAQTASSYLSVPAV